MRWGNGSYLARMAFLCLILKTAAAQKLTTSADKSFDFKGAKSYAWGKNHIITRQGKAVDAQINEKIVEEVNRSLVAKGFKEDSAHPDFYISYEAGASDALGQVESIGVPPPVTTTTVGPIYGLTPNVWYSVEGHITFQITDAKSNKPVWTTLATKKIRDPHKGLKDPPGQIEKIVSKVFKKFPPKGD
jgi:Domain of unknown function (DUF4136)